MPPKCTVGALQTRAVGAALYSCKSGALGKKHSAGRMLWRPLYTSWRIQREEKASRILADSLRDAVFFSRPGPALQPLPMLKNHCEPWIIMVLLGSKSVLPVTPGWSPGIPALAPTVLHVSSFTSLSSSYGPSGCRGVSPVPRLCAPTNPTPHLHHLHQGHQVSQ